VFAIAGFTAEDVVINTFGYHLIPTGLALDQVLTQIGATVIPAGVGNADLQVKMMLDLGVTAYIGTPSWLMALIQKAEVGQVGNLSHQFCLQKALVSAEPLPPALRQTFVEKYGLRVTNAYGTAELGFLAYNTEGGLAMRLLKTPIIQVVNPETGKSAGPGETGEVVVTTFNETYPLIRFGTGDLSSYISEPCPCGRTANRLTGILGRTGDAVKVRGMFVIARQAEQVCLSFEPVARFQIAVSRRGQRDEMNLKLELKHELVGEAKQKLSDELSQHFQNVCRIRPDSIDFVSAGTITEGQPKIVDQRTWE